MGTPGVSFTLPDIESIAPLAVRTYDVLMAELRDLLPGREVDAFEVMLELLRRCRRHDEALKLGF
jgi:hypothetical protein